MKRLIFSYLLLSMTIDGVSQKLNFTTVPITILDSISIQLEIGDFPVPENRTDPNSRQINLKVARIKAKQDLGYAPVMYLSGGPGGSAINDLRVSHVAKMLMKLNQTHDLILMDQRGTGNSTPKMVWSATHDFRIEHQDLTKNIFLDEKSTSRVLKAFASESLRFFKEEGFALGGYNTLESSHDINAVCDELSIDQIHLVGFSYGTHLTLSTLKYYPQLIKSAVCIGTEGLNNTLKLPETYNEQIRKISLLAKSDPKWKNKESFEELLRQIYLKLTTTPLKLEIKNAYTNKIDTILFGAHGLQMVIRADIGDRNDFIYLPKMLDDLNNGDLSLLKSFVTKRYNQYQFGVHGMALSMNLSSWASKDRLKMINKQIEKSMLGNSMNFIEMTLRDQWEYQDLGDEYRSDFNCAVPTLFISGSLDSNTTPEQTKQVSRGFSDFKHIIVENAGHESMIPNDEVVDALSAFIDSGNVPIRRISTSIPVFIAPKME
ncbi:MAG: alpha/beta fold hydrolase [Ekhidna sp.]|uniref:alpha/beta fold hydrolase n=1 Tax=Ekhidna sp. TaxID=2608089 RepID=UPI0032EA9319